jgi:hypothetical protein
MDFAPQPPSWDTLEGALEFDPSDPSDPSRAGEESPRPSSREAAVSPHLLVRWRAVGDGARLLAGSGLVRRVADLRMGATVAAVRAAVRLRMRPARENHRALILWGCVRRRVCGGGGGGTFDVAAGGCFENVAAPADGGRREGGSD